MVYIGLIDSYVEPIIQALKQNITDLPAEIIDAMCEWENVVFICFWTYHVSSSKSTKVIENNYLSTGVVGKHAKLY